MINEHETRRMRQNKEQIKSEGCNKSKKSRLIKRTNRDSRQVIEGESKSSLCKRDK